MSNPNIINTTQIYGRTTTKLVSSDATTLVENPNNSGKILKINSIVVSNIVSSDVSFPLFVNVFDGSDSAFLAYNISVPDQSTLVVSSKDTSFYLEENSAVEVYSDGNDRLSVLCSFEEIF